MAVEIRKMNARIAMVKKGVNAKQLSQKVPIDYIYLTKILNDKSKPSELMVIKIANALDVEVSEIFNIKEEVR
ncbi:helix-turn-helix domain-containing protein [Staphylococcus cohnii]|uniref:helix-turn-helix domain-containing protein n=1 Tax=Staphylococcus cohnii TaxID=29382 RepID=UPI003D7C548E